MAAMKDLQLKRWDLLDRLGKLASDATELQRDAQVLWGATGGGSALEGQVAMDMADVRQKVMGLIVDYADDDYRTSKV